MFSDEELVKQIQNGDESAQYELFNRYKDYVKKISRGYFIVGAEFEDTLQEGMIGLYRATKHFDTSQTETSFKTFAIVCIRHQIITAIKKALADKNKALSFAVSFQSFDKDNESVDYLPFELVLDVTPAEQAIDKENFIALKKQIKDCLSDFEIKVLTYYLQGYSYKEIASKLESPKKSVDNALIRIKAKLREKLN